MAVRDAVTPRPDTKTGSQKASSRFYRALTSTVTGISKCHSCWHSRQRIPTRIALFSTAVPEMRGWPDTRRHSGQGIGKCCPFLMESGIFSLPRAEACYEAAAQRLTVSTTTFGGEGLGITSVNSSPIGGWGERAV